MLSRTLVQAPRDCQTAPGLRVHVSRAATEAAGWRFHGDAGRAGPCAAERGQLAAQPRQVGRVHLRNRAPAHLRRVLRAAGGPVGTDTQGLDEAAEAVFARTVIYDWLKRALGLTPQRPVRAGGPVTCAAARRPSSPSGCRSAAAKAAPWRTLPMYWNVWTPAARDGPVPSRGRTCATRALTPRPVAIIMGVAIGMVSCHEERRVFGVGHRVRGRVDHVCIHDHDTATDGSGERSIAVFLRSHRIPWHVSRWPRVRAQCGKGRAQAVREIGVPATYFAVSKLSTDGFDNRSVPGFSNHCGTPDGDGPTRRDCARADRYRGCSNGRLARHCS